MAYLFILYHTIARILCIRKPAAAGLPGRRRSPLYIYNITWRVLQLRSYSIPTIVLILQKLVHFFHVCKVRVTLQ